MPEIPTVQSRASYVMVIFDRSQVLNPSYNFAECWYARNQSGQWTRKRSSTNRFKPTSRFCTQQNPSKQNQHHYTWLQCSLCDVVVKGIVGQNTSKYDKYCIKQLKTAHLLKHVVRFWRVSFAFLTFRLLRWRSCHAQLLQPGSGCSAGLLGAAVAMLLRCFLRG